ncbi:hypothetical protein STRDD12_01340 [Streptococcus sp. DD12]|nr:hypothetical protein STRDD12_01340 [Streptococcus sp. DD12]
MAKEAGTLFMAMGSEPDQLERTYVIEIYADDAAYQAHAQSEHFKAFASFAADHLQGRQMEPLVPQILLEKPEALQLLETNAYNLRLARLTLAPDKLDLFKARVTKEMLAALETEAGVRSLFAGQLAGQKDQWLFIELYQDDAAYESHRQRPHFTTYIEETKDLVIAKDLLSLKLDLLVSKGKLTYLS